MTYKPLARTVIFLSVLLCSFIAAAQQPSSPISGKSIPKFVDLLPVLDLTTPGHGIQTVAFPGGSETVLRMCEFKANVMPRTFVPANGSYTGTWVWGYRVGDCPAADAPAVDSYIGPVFVTERDVPTQIKFVNALPDNPHVYWRDWTDQTLHWADPLHFQANHCAHGMEESYCFEHYTGPVAAVPHLHGAETPPVLDGGPNAWFTSDGVYHGNAYYSMDGNTDGNYAIYRYLNAQEAAPIWFHDHLLGGTRLNVYAGLAGAYVITDPGLHLPAGLHPAGLQQGAHGSVDYVVPLVLQDRMFDADGQLFFPNEGNNPTVHPYWVPEFVGDTIVVNGKVWPRLEVQARRYRFLIINGSNARTYELWLDNPSKKSGPAIWQIATGGGYLEKPVKIDPTAASEQLQKLRLMPGERADVIIDFAAYRGQTLILRNNARTPYPKGEPPNGATLGEVLQIVVGSTAVPDLSYDPATLTPLRDAAHPLVRLVDPATGAVASNVHIDKTRELTLNEVVSPMDEPLEILVNNTKWDGMQIAQDGSRVVRNDFTGVTIGGLTEYYSELPDEGTTELWEIVNLTADAHPIHTHLTQFQLLNRQAYNLNKYRAAYAAAFPGGAYLPAFGPPRDYDKSTTGSGQKYGGNPNVDPYLQGPARPPDANEAGWKDTIMAPPGMVTRFVVRYAPTSKAVDATDLYYPFDPQASGFGYVWHCHIIDHEDNEMMRPYRVTPKSGVTRTYVQGTDY
jgi:FtsP/CotA-like multicopper oxidase with cupredoxin domain